MYVSAVAIQGLRGAPTWTGAAWERVVDLPGDSTGVAVSDAFEVLVGTLDPAQTRASMLALGLLHAQDESDFYIEDGLLHQVTVPDPASVTAWMDVAARQHVTVSVTFIPDPPFYGTLRDLALREPRLVAGMAAEAAITIRVDWLLSQDRTMFATSIHEVSVGGVNLLGTTGERPAWLVRIARDIASRVGVVDPREPIEAIEARLHAASLSHERTVRASYARAARALEEPPFSLGPLAWVRTARGTTPRFGPDLLSSRQVGVRADEALRLVEAVFVRAPDVLVLEAPGRLQPSTDAVARWLADCTHGEGATLEQVVRIGGAGA